MANRVAAQNDVESPEAPQSASCPDKAQAVGLVDKAALHAELARLREKAFQKETFTRQEKITLLKTRFFPYKALAAPESLSLEERYRLLMRPPPEEVRENIMRISNGVSSTPVEMYKRAADDADALTTRELMLMGVGFFDLDGIYDGSRHMTWANKWKEAGEAALEYIGTKEELRGHHAAMKVLHILPGREEERGAIMEEKIVAIGSNDKARERAGEKSRVWELHDQRLLHEAALSMDALLRELVKNEE